MKLLRKVKEQISLRKYLILYLLILPWMLFQVESAMGQTGTKSVTGKVSDTGNLPLPGVTVFLKGTTIGTTTNADGIYNLTKVPENSILVFSFVGMKKQEIVVSTRTTIDVVLESETIGLDEVVAIGYGTQKKKDLTGSIVRMEMDGKEQAANTSLVQALQGYSPGLNASGGSSAGDGGSFSIRGRTSLSASDQPLVVLDGIIYNGSINDLNVNDIQSVDILKDASAAAVYGSRSANGVLVVTTKKGTSGKPKFSFNAYYGVQDLSNTERTKVMNAEQYAVRLVDYYYQQDLYAWYKTGPTSANGRPVRPDISDRDLVASFLRTEEEQINYLAGNSVDWVDEVLGV